MTREAKTEDVDILIVGGGPAGLSAGIYAARGNQKAVILDGKKPSALALAHEINNYPGISRISGKGLLENMREHARKSGAKIVKGDVISAALDMTPKMIITRDNTTYMAKSVIVATGRKMNDKLPNEEKFIGRGVSYCALCDGPLYRNQNVVIYGEDEEAVEDALALEQMNVKVTLVSQKSLEKIKRESSKPHEINSLIEKNIPVYENFKILEIVGDEGDGSFRSGGVTSVIVGPVDSKGSRNGTQEISTQAVFIISHVLSDSLLKNAGLHVDEKGWVEVDSKLQTNLDGVFAAGDITGEWLQVVGAAAQGGMAGAESNKWIRHFDRSSGTETSQNAREEVALNA